MKSILSAVPHTITPGVTIFEVWHDGKFIATVTGGDGPRDRVISINNFCTGFTAPNTRSPRGCDGTPSSPVTRSVLSIRFLPTLDRIWYRQRPVIFEFRPANQIEAYKFEADYWRSIHDESRATLATEIRDRIAKEHESAIPDSNSLKS